MTMRLRVGAAMALLSWLLFATHCYAQFLPPNKDPQQKQTSEENTTAGQDTSAPPPEQQSTQTQAPANQSNQTSGAFRQRLLYIVPDFWAQNLDANIRPLTPNQKFELFVRTTVDRSTLLAAGVSAAINQASDDPERYDQNFRGYAQRYGLVMASTAVSNGLKDAALPILFRQDPRYFRLNRGTVRRRTLYAFSRVAIARSDRGTFVVNWSELLGSFGTAAISNTWHAKDDRTFASTMGRGALSIGFDAGFNLLKEFWPELKRRLGTGSKPAGQTGNPVKRKATSDPVGKETAQ